MNVSLSSLPVVLTVVFLVLKLTHVIAWSWWLVFLPLIISGGIFVVIFLFAAIVALLASL
jgi:hypothetical protein